MIEIDNKSLDYIADFVLSRIVEEPIFQIVCKAVIDHDLKSCDKHRLQVFDEIFKTDIKNKLTQDDISRIIESIQPLVKEQ